MNINAQPKKLNNQETSKKEFQLALDGFLQAIPSQSKKYLHNGEQVSIPERTIILQDLFQKLQIILKHRKFLSKKQYQEIKKRIPQFNNEILYVLDTHRTPYDNEENPLNKVNTLLSSLKKK